MLPVFLSTVLLIGGFCGSILTGGAAEERGRRGEGAQGKGDHGGRGRLPRLRRPAAQEPHRHGSQGQNWGRGFSLSDGLHCVVRFLLLLCSAIPSGLLAVDVVPNLVALGIKLRRLQMCIRNAGLVVLRY